MEKISDYRAKKYSHEISVLMPTYNRSSLFYRSINSILNQSHKDFEFIILDDGSTDNSLYSLFIYLIKDDRIRVYFNRQNKGRPFSRNKLIDLSTSKYLAIMDSDDFSYPNRLEKQYTYMKNHPEIDIVTSHSSYNGKKGGHEQDNPETTERLLINLLFDSSIVHPTIMMKKNFLEHHHIRYDESYTIVDDYSLTTQLLLAGAKFHMLTDTLIDVREHKTNGKEYYEIRQREAWLIHNKLQTAIIGPQKKSLAIDFCPRLERLKEINKEKRLFDQPTIEQTFIEHCGWKNKNQSKSHILQD